MSKFTDELRQEVTAGMFLRAGDMVAELDAQRKRAADLLDEAEKALAGMLQHSCVSDTDPEDKFDEDHLAERLARATLARIRGEKA